MKNKIEQYKNYLINQAKNNTAKGFYKMLLTFYKKQCHRQLIIFIFYHILKFSHFPP